MQEGKNGVFSTDIIIPLFCIVLVYYGKIGKFNLTFFVKMGYNTPMFGGILSFFSRLLLVAAIFGIVWRFVEPRTQLMRILRAALLLLALLGTLAVIRIFGVS